MLMIGKIFLAAAVVLFMSLALPVRSVAADNATTLKGKAAAPDALIAVGSPPVGFSLQSLESQTVKLEDYLGKEAVLLVFWSFFCGPCREEIPEIDKLGKQHTGQGLEVLAINVDGPKLEKPARQHMTVNNFTFRVLWEEFDGPKLKTADAYGVGGTPTLVLVGKNGKVSWTHVGRDSQRDLENQIRKALGLG